MNDYQLAYEMFTVPNKLGKKILYFPLAGILIDANDSLIDLLYHFEEKELVNLTSEEKKELEYLIEKGLITKKGDGQFLNPVTKNEIPYKLTLFPTNSCNLECTYCYAAKTHSKPLIMNWEIVESAVEYYINLMLQQNKTIFNLELHGGGEPFYEWNLVQRTITYIEEICCNNNFKLDAVSSTNGILSTNQLEWIVKHFSFILVSFEVLPDIQNKQRPFENQKPSFYAVDKTIKYFDKTGFSYGIRITVTANNENLLKETIDFVIENYKTNLIFFEPVNICGNNQNAREVDLNNFIENFILLEKYAEQKGIKIRYSGADIEKLSSNFCYAGTAQFAITPEGYLTNCWEVTDMKHPLANIFIFGEIKSNGQLEINKEKQNFLQSLKVQNFKYCQNCFAKWHCAGDCLARLYDDGFENSRGNARCITNREIIANKLLQTLK